MKRTVFIIMAALLLLLPVRAGDAAPETSAGAMLLIHPDSGRILAEKNAGTPLPMASTTKLMTALIAAQELDPEAVAEIAPEWTRTEGSSMYLRPGEHYTVRQLLEGLLLASGNDAAVALACITAGDEAAFTVRMNEKAAQLGLENTHFANPHGLDAPDHRSTAADLAALMAEVMKNDLLREILSEQTCIVRGVTYENHNRLLRTCPGVCAGKTGYTSVAGRCLVSVCRREDLELICVTLDDRDDWKDHAALYDWAFGAYRSLLIPAGEELCSVPVISGESEGIGAAVPAPVSLCVSKEETPEIVCGLSPFVFAPLEKGERLGELRIDIDGQTAAVSPLVSAEPCRRAYASAPVYRRTVDRIIGIYAV